jgi:putative transcriptional regulator
MKQLGINIKIARIKKGVSQKEFASKIGKTANFLCLIENGKRTPSIRLLSKMAKELGITMSELFREVDK